jgi:hypothetical protein
MGFAIRQAHRTAFATAEREILFARVTVRPTAHARLQLDHLYALVTLEFGLTDDGLFLGSSALRKLAILLDRLGVLLYGRQAGLDSFRRCALPITALRVTPSPSALAISAAVLPSPHKLLE